MNTLNPRYLRLHRADTSSNQDAGKLTDELAAFWDCFQATTGWRLDNRAHWIGPPKLIAAGETDSETAEPPRLPMHQARQLAAAGSKVIVRLRDAEQAVRRQDAELLAKSQIPWDIDQQYDFLESVDAILRDAVQAIGCTAAAIYMLDDDTTELKMRSQFGLPDRYLSEPPRPLRGSLADLEAMMSGVVTIEDCAAGDEIYQSPIPMGAAICAVICVDELPVGTLWFWNTGPMLIDDSARAAASLTARCVAAEIRSWQRSQCKEGPSTESGEREIVKWQQAALPKATHLAPGWYVDGIQGHPKPLLDTWYTWDALPDGSLVAALAQAHANGPQAAMIAATARSAFQSHLAYRLTPRQVLQRVADSLWQTNLGVQLVSLMYARINPDTGEALYACAGGIDSLIVSQYGYRPLGIHNEPLCNRVDYIHQDHEFRLLPGEVLWMSAGPLATSEGLETAAANHLAGCDQRRAAITVQASMREGPEAIVPTMEKEFSRSDHFRHATVVILCRKK